LQEDIRNHHTIKSQTVLNFKLFFYLPASSIRPLANELEERSVEELKEIIRLIRLSPVGESLAGRFRDSARLSPGIKIIGYKPWLRVEDLIGFQV
jgi:hypothetical protein